MNDYCKILIIDDEFIMRQGIKYMIDWEKEGFQIIGQASNGQEAIEMIKKQEPDIIISDIVMPQIDGIELSRYINTNYPNISIIILSSYSDFEYVKSSFQNGAVDYLLKPTLEIDTLLASIKSAAGRIKNFTLPSNSTIHLETMLKRILLGFTSDIDFNKLNNIFHYDKFFIFGTAAKKIYKNYEERTYFIKTFISELNMFLSSNFINITFNTISLDNETIICLINFNFENSSYLTYELKKFSQIFAEKYPDCFFVLSLPFNNLNEIKDVYNKNFLLLCSQYFYNKGCNFFTYSDYKIPPFTQNFNFKLFSELISYMKINDAFNMLLKYISNSSINKSLSELELKNIIQNCTYTTLSNFENMQVNAFEINSLKQIFFNEIEQATYADELITICNKICNTFISLKNKYESNFNTHMINNIIQYIQNNYSQPLTLTEVAKKFNFNYSYLSSYFSSHNHEGFNEFLNKIRIEKSCELLKKDIPISSISSMVGYSDQSYYSKVFKKFTGYTPSNYRKILID